MAKKVATKSVNWRPISLTYAGILSSGFVDVGRAAIFSSVLVSFTLSQGVGAWYYSLPTLAQLITTLFSRWWLPRFGTHQSFVFFFAAQFVSTVAIAVSGTLVKEQGLPLLLGGVTIAGLNSGGMAILNNVLISHSAPQALQRRLMSGLHSVFGIACLASPLLITVLLHLGLTWSVAFGLIGLLPFLVASVASFQKWPTVRSVASEKSVGFRRDHLYMACVAGLYSAAEATLTSRLSLFSETVAGWSPRSASFLLSLFYIGMFIGRSSFAAFNVRLPIRFLLLASAISSTGVFILGLQVSPVYLALTGFTMSAFFPLLMGLVNEEYEHELREVTTRLTVGVAFTSSLLHWVVGWLSDRCGLQKALYVGPFAFALVAILLLFELRRRD